MKIKIYLLLIIIPLGHLNAQGWETPIIDGYGEVKYFEKAKIKPNPTVDYKLLFDIKNETEKNGINLFVCSQATASRNIDYESINKKVTPALSGLSVLATYQLESYVYMPY